MDYKRMNYPWFYVAVILVFHLVGLLYTLFSRSDAILKLTPFNLLLSALCLALQAGLSKRALSLSFIIFSLGWMVEVAGVQSGVIFGEYYYGDKLGPKLLGAPLIIGLNWLLLIWSGDSIALKFTSSKWMRALITASLMTALDVLIEPVAIHYNFWKWNDGQPPFQNYVAWFVISFLFSLIWQRTDRLDRSIVPIVFYLIQCLFFGGLLAFGTNF